MPKKGVLQKITRSAYYYKDGSKYKPLYSHKYMKDYPSTGRKSYVIYRKTRDTKGKPFYGRFYRKSEILTKTNKNYSKKKIRTRRAKRKTQRGGLVPCIPCIAAAAPAAKIAAATAAGAGIWVAKHLSGFSHKSSSSRTMKNGRESIVRTETYEIQNKNGETKEKKFTQDGTKLNLAGKKSKESSVKEATVKFNAAVKRCVKSGFKKC